jgi:predicted ArsR family transcriptional regulator
MKNTDNANTANRVEIDDPGQAKLLTNPESFRFLEPFMARDCTVSQAAKELKCNVDTMLYRVKTFVKAGLLKVVKTQSRRGRSIKVYRSSADKYFVPFEITPYEDVEAFFRKSRKANDDILIPRFAKIIRQTGREGRIIYRDDKGEVWTSSAGSFADIFVGLGDSEKLEQRLRQKRQIAENSNDILWLTEEEARDFVMELYKVWGKHKRVDKSRRKPYFLTLLSSQWMSKLEAACATLLLKMKQSEPASRLEVKDPKQARLLSDPQSFRYFGPFLARACTVSGAAKELNCKVDTMLYRVKTFVEAGLLKIVETEHRRGRPVKIYRSSADAYLFPLPLHRLKILRRLFNKGFRSIMKSSPVT